MKKTSKTPRYFRALILFIAFAFFMIGCSSNADDTSEEGESTEDQQTEDVSADESEEENTETESEGSELYHEIGETFEIEGYSSGVPAEITVNDIWTEDGDEHQQYIEDTIASPSDEDVVVFADYTVENIGDRSINMGDVIPEYAGPNGSLDLDLSYPENDTFTDHMESFQESIDAGESMDLVGAIATDEKAPYTGALMWNFTQDIPEIVFQTPQEERRDQIGTYDVGEDMYIKDYGEDTFFKVNISNIEIVEDQEDIEKGDENNSLLAIDMTFDNQLDEEAEFQQAFPLPYVESAPDGQGAARSTYFITDGQVVEDLYEGSEGKINAGETAEGTVYYEIINDDIEDVQLYYPNPPLLTFPDYGMWINYNLEN